uniref:RRM domain-containing protein n=1 Tax=Arion vulgaris TaxID=1028688 RepID=A0A0B7ASE3_9EUPU
MSDDQGYVVRLRGLPWSTKADEVLHFLRECEVAGEENGIHFTYSREGRPSGEAFVELVSEDDVSNALAQNNEHIGDRYIEVFRVNRSEMEWMVKRAGSSDNKADAVVKLRGLPFGCSKEEIAQFFTGLEIVPNGIMLPEDRQGRSTGEAFVQFASSQIAERALEKHKERIGHRYIEIFKSSMSEANSTGSGIRGGIRPLMAGSMSRPGPYDRGDRFGLGMGMMGYGGRGRNLKGFFENEYDDFSFGGGMGFGFRSRRGGMGSARGEREIMDRRGVQPGSYYISKTGYSVHMRGLPFQAAEQDVFDFFSPIQPVRCEFEFGDNGRPTGEANVDFATHQEAIEAMKKHKSNMQHRYIELFLNSEPSARSSLGGGYGNGAGFGLGTGDDYDDSIDIRGYGHDGGSSFSGRYGGGSGQGSYGSSQGGFGSQGGGYGSGSGFGNQGGLSSYDLDGYGDELGGGGGRLMGSSYTAF